MHPSMRVRTCVSVCRILLSQHDQTDSMIFSIYTAIAMTMSRAVLKSYPPKRAIRTVSEWDDGESVPVLPALIMQVDGNPTAALFYEKVGKEKHAIRFVYNSTAMSHRGHMAACRRLLDRECVEYDSLSFSDWFSLVGSTKGMYFA